MRSVRILIVSVALAIGLTEIAQADWTTYHADSALSGVDTSSGSAVPFTPAWSAPNLNGVMWASPLVFGGLVIVATEANDLYAFHESDGSLAWHTPLGTPVDASTLPCGDITPTVGITSTPVIDPASGTLYAVADLKSGASADHTLYALDARTGTVAWHRSVEPPYDTPLNQLQRPALALSRGRVLVGFGGNDGDCAQYRGYLVSAPENDAGGNAVYAVPTTREGAIWAGGGAPAVDPAGNVYVATGNAASSSPSTYDHGDTVEKLSPDTATELDYWAPSSWAQDSGADADLGSAAPELLSGMLFQAGKNGNGYLVSTSSLGHIGGELFSAPVCRSFGADAYANGVLYVACTNGVHALDIDLTNRRFSARWAGPSDANGPPILSGGLLWVTATGTSKLYGLDPATGAVKVTQPTASMEHFVTPAASDGKLFLATGSTLSAYTIATAVTPAPNPSPAPTPTPTPTPGRRSLAPAAPCRHSVLVRLHAPRGERVVGVRARIGRHPVRLRFNRRTSTFRWRPIRSGNERLVITETLRGRRGRRTVTLRRRLVLPFRACRLIVARGHASAR